MLQAVWFYCRMAYWETAETGTEFQKLPGAQIQAAQRMARPRSMRRFRVVPNNKEQLEPRIALTATLFGGPSMGFRWTLEVVGLRRILADPGKGCRQQENHHQCVHVIISAMSIRAAAQSQQNFRKDAQWIGPMFVVFEGYRTSGACWNPGAERWKSRLCLRTSSMPRCSASRYQA